MSELVHKSHNVSALLYHAVCPTKYRRAVISEEVGAVLRRVCIEIGNRFEVTFLRSRSLRSGPTVTTSTSWSSRCRPTARRRSSRRSKNIIKSITAREVFARVPSVKQALWGGAFWSSGYHIDTVGRHGSEGTIRDYIASQGRQQEYRRLHSQPMEPPAQQLELF